MCRSHPIAACEKLNSYFLLYYIVYIIIFVFKLRIVGKSWISFNFTSFLFAHILFLYFFDANIQNSANLLFI